MGQLGVLAMSLKPGGSSVTLSPWLIHTLSMPWPSGVWKSWMSLSIHRRHITAVSQHGDAVADTPDFRHAVGDIDDADTAGLQLFDKGEQLIGLVIGQRSGRLIEDQNRKLRPEGLGDLDHLLLGTRKVIDPPAGVEMEVEFIENAARFRAQFPTVDKAVSRRFRSQKHVFLDRHLRNEGKLLKHGGNAQFAGIMHRCEIDRLAAKADPAGSGLIGARQDRDQGRLACTVLAEENVYLSGAQIEVDAVKRPHPGVLLAHVFGGKEDALGVRIRTRGCFDGRHCDTPVSAVIRR